ncbi:uroporphyrinogen-III C-methyltransferase [Psychromonas hadalis]|uniref:uroporphyrinogen-III C-methyltransferase n=1 Tax=Psychromonas hadalis TaxID=211669 RepID=UPI0003B6C2B7|nr:uroporphyrinogen-III C-methyltransferase [Psychromonas hadalis]
MIFESSKGELAKFPANAIEAHNVATLKVNHQGDLGLVSLVGAGPGDADLLTLKAFSVIQQADVIVYDNLVSEEIRALFPATIEKCYVGKMKGLHSLTQSEINQLLINKALQGLNVCRLKGGDAFVFGRGGEEMLELKAQGIQVEIVPGITAAAGCSSYAGIPLTHRGISQGCTFVTAHAEKELSIKWHALAKLDHTLVFYMGLSKAELIETQLIKAGLERQTPVAFIENGCCPEQRVITGTLQQLASLVGKHQIKSPALIMVGKVVALAEQLQWVNEQQNIDSVITQLSA